MHAGCGLRAESGVPGVPRCRVSSGGVALAATAAPCLRKPHMERREAAAERRTRGAERSASGRRDSLRTAARKNRPLAAVGGSGDVRAPDGRLTDVSGYCLCPNSAMATEALCTARSGLTEVCRSGRVANVRNTQLR
ncbi:hypothetical protein GN956_G19034 [Arapaima gigas]